MTAPPQRPSPNPGTVPGYVKNVSTHGASKSLPLAWLWNKATAEWV